jgi:integrase
MARTVRDAKLDSRAAREKLKAGERHWRALDPGLHIGYRKGATGGKWLLRRYAGDGTYKLETIGVADDKADADGVAALSWAQAQQKARGKHAEYTRAAQGLPATGPYTVKACLDDYLAFLETHRKSAKDVRWRAEALILPTLGDIACADLTAPRLRRWLQDAANAAPRVRTAPGAEQQYRRPRKGEDDAERRRKRCATANRTLTTLRAALNLAWREGKVPSDHEWRRVEPFREADASRLRYLTLDECRRLINASEGEFRDLVRAALLTGCRFGELAALQVRDFNIDTGTLHIRTSKSGKSRHVVLNAEGIDLFTKLSAGRPDTEVMLRQPNGDRWGRSNQSLPIAKACRRAKIESANFHALRHTYASHSVMNGAPLLVVAKNLGHTDTRMVEKHYGHLSESYIADAIRAAAPSFGVADDRTVTPIAGRP